MRRSTSWPVGPALPLAVLSAAAAFAASVALGLHGAGVWRLPPTVTVASAVVVALVTPIASVRRVLDDRRLSHRLLFERQVSETLTATLVRVVQVSGLDWLRVGVNAWMIRRSSWRTRAEVLERVGRARISASPPPATVEWTLDKGVVGACWRSQADEARNLAHDFAGFEGMGEREWLQLGVEERLGLSFADYRQTREDGAIVATPMFDPRGAIIGVVSADAPGDAYDRLWTDDVRATLQSAAVTIRNLHERR